MDSLKAFVLIYTIPPNYGLKMILKKKIILGIHQHLGHTNSILLRTYTCNVLCYGDHKNRRALFYKYLSLTYYLKFVKIQSGKE